MENNISLARKIALTGAFSALVVVLSVTPLGFISIGAASVTILQIPVILAVLLGGLPSGVFTGAVFGVMSLINASLRPSGPLDPMFLNPLCSILPRILFAVCAWGLWRLLKLIPKLPKTISAGVTAFVSTLIHTVLVMGSLYMVFGKDIKELFSSDEVIVDSFKALLALVVSNALFEAIASTVVCVLVFAGLYISEKRKSKLSRQ
jgi:uncharacterized membrane protein